MAVRLDKPWRSLDAAGVAALPVQLGVYQIADGEGAVVRIAAAGGRELFGLRSALAREHERLGDGHRFRIEITTAYHTRWQELLMVHVHDHGALPRDNETDRPAKLGRLSPAG